MRTKYNFVATATALGLETEKVSFADVYGLDAELLAMVSKPVYAVLMLFPISKEYEDARATEHERLVAQASDTQLLEKRLIFIKLSSEWSSFSPPFHRQAVCIHIPGCTLISLTQSDGWTLRQTISNACGTIGLLHALANNPKIPISQSIQSVFYCYF